MSNFEEIYNNKTKELKDLESEYVDNNNKIKELEAMTSKLYRHVIKSEEELLVAKQYNELFKVADNTLSNKSLPSNTDSGHSEKQNITSELL